MALLLTEAEVTELLTMEDAIAAVEAAFRAMGRGEATNIPRRRGRLPGGMLHLMGGAVPGAGYGFKAYTGGRGRTRFLVGLFSPEDGSLLALMEADRLGQQRTGAASGVATRYLARPDARTVGLIGAGWQARSQLEAVCAVRRVTEARVYSRDPERRAAFAREMGAALGVEVRPVASAREAADGADVVITATSSRDPVLEGAWLAPGCHVNAIGSNALNRRELDEAAVLRAGLIAADSVEQCKLEAGDLAPLVDAGRLRWEAVVELGAIVAGQAAGRTAPDQITLFKSLGLGIEDVAVAAHLYTLARERGVGREVEML